MKLGWKLLVVSVGVNLLLMGHEVYMASRQERLGRLVEASLKLAERRRLELELMYKSGDCGVLIGRLKSRVSVIDLVTGSTIIVHDGLDLGPGDLFIRPALRSVR